MLPAGHDRKVYQDMYELPWTASCDLMMLGSIMQACRVRELDAQGIALRNAMQSGKCETAASALEHPWFNQYDGST